MNQPAKCKDFIQAVRAKGQEFLVTADKEAEDPDIADMYQQNGRWLVDFAQLMQDGLWSEVEQLFHQAGSMYVDLQMMPGACEMFVFIESFKEAKAA